jgi:hypothetical protein
VQLADFGQRDRYRFEPSFSWSQRDGSTSQQCSIPKPFSLVRPHGAATNLCNDQIWTNNHEFLEPPCDLVIGRESSRAAAAEFAATRPGRSPRNTEHRIVADEAERRVFWITAEVWKSNIWDAYERNLKLHIFVHVWFMRLCLLWIGVANSRT